MLIILTEGVYDGFKKSGMKPCEYCVQKLHLKNVKSYFFVREYFENPEILLKAIREYKRVSHTPHGEFCLADLVKS